MQDNQQNYPEGDQEENNYGEDEYEMDWTLEAKSSLENPYNVYELNQLTSKIYEENLQRCDLTSLSPAWNLMLFTFCDFSIDMLIFVIDQEQTGRRMIRYDEAYSPKIAVGECPVCYDSTELISNPCGHAFCFNCWISYMRVAHCDRSQYELFPMCQWDECFHRTNLMLMEQVWLRCPEMKQYFERLLCLKYSQKSDRVRLCSREGCNKAILINFTTDITIVCQCGNKLCTICGESDYFPLSCGDFKTWNKILNDKENQWINELIVKKCPMCKTPIDKNEGSTHLTCRCKYEFCWICLKVWKGHTYFGQCDSVKKEDHQKKLFQEQQKRKKNEREYSLRFQETKCQIERLSHLFKRVLSIDMQQVVQSLNEHHILTNDTMRLRELKEMILNVVELRMNSQIYIFLQRKGYQVLQNAIQEVWKKASQLDDYLTSRISIVDCTISMFKQRQDLVAIKAKEFIDEIKRSFVLDKEKYNEILKTTKKQYEEILVGTFMYTKMNLE